MTYQRGLLGWSTGIGEPRTMRPRCSATNTCRVRAQTNCPALAGLSAALGLETQLNCDGVHKSAADQSRKDKWMSLLAPSACGTRPRMGRHQSASIWSALTLGVAQP